MTNGSKKEGNPVHGRLNSWLLNTLGTYTHHLYGTRKKKLFSSINGSVVEIGAGTGANLRYLKKGISLTAIEPNVYMHKRLRSNADKYELKVKISDDRAEKMDIQSDSVDVVFSTLTLCTIRNETKALKEIKRILKPGGRFVFIEHVGARKGSLLRAIQVLVHKPWHWFFEGCHTHKNISKSIHNTGFSSVHIECFNLYSPFIPITPQISGFALK